MSSRAGGSWAACTRTAAASAQAPRHVHTVQRRVLSMARILTDGPASEQASRAPDRPRRNIAPTSTPTFPLTFGAPGRIAGGSIGVLPLRGNGGASHGEISRPAGRDEVARPLGPDVDLHERDVPAPPEHPARRRDRLARLGRAQERDVEVG